MSDVVQERSGLELEAAVIRSEGSRHQCARWPKGHEAAGSRAYQMCTRTVMDVSDPDISFDARGVCNWVPEFEQALATEILPAEARPAALERAVREMREAGKHQPYDCILGLSGGVDSSYLCHLAVELGLRPLVVHFDNGWNSELAVANIEQMVRKLGLDLHTFVMDWPEFRDLQRSYFKASVLDLEVPTDHMIFGAIFKIAAQHRVKHVLSGNNIQTEWVLPRAWYYSKFDLANLVDIHRRYGTVPLRNLPKLGFVQAAWYNQALRMTNVRMLDLIEYDKPRAKQMLIDEYGWRDYGGKHHESVFTRFYQGHILPKKFNIDKRKAHWSNLILVGQATREEALRDLLSPPYDESMQRDDFTFVAKKLGFSRDELRELLEQPNRSHGEFASDQRLRAAYMSAMRVGRPVKPFLRPLGRALRQVRQWSSRS